MRSATGCCILHSVSSEQIESLARSFGKYAPMYTVVGAKNTLDPEDPDYSPAYVSEQFATREDAERDEIACGYPLTKIEERADWIMPAWLLALQATTG